MFELFYSSGLRLAELAALDCDALDSALHEGEVRVLGKRSKARTGPGRQQGARGAGGLGGACATRWRPVEDGAVRRPRGGPLSHRMIQERLGRGRCSAGLPRHVHPHMLRHSFASHVLQSSGDLRAVQEMLGHASIASTQVYTHLDFQHLAKVYDSAHPRAKR
jgi:integrase/recombinase XerC